MTRGLHAARSNTDIFGERLRLGWAAQLLAALLPNKSIYFLSAHSLHIDITQPADKLPSRIFLRNRMALDAIEADNL